MPRFTPLLLVLLAACVTTTPTQTEQLIRDRGMAWERAFNAGSSADVSMVYSSDAVLLPPNSAMVTGRDAISTYFDPFFTSGQRVTISLVPAETRVSGSLAYRTGTFQIKTADGSVVDDGNFMEIWERIGGEWLLIRDIWNSSRPAPGS